MSDPIVALDSDKVTRLTGLSQATLANWERQGIFQPSSAEARNEGGLPRIYSFRDVVGLRALAKIRKDLRIPLSEIREAGQYLARHADAPWAALRFGVVERKLVFRDPATQEWVGDFGGSVLELDLEGVPEEIELAIPAVLKRDEASHGRVTRHRLVRHNEPVIAGTRIPVATIRRFHEAGVSTQGIIAEYPQLTEDDIAAALAFEDGEAGDRNVA